MFTGVGVLMKDVELVCSVFIVPDESEVNLKRNVG
jgi:hypothetical protein